MNSAEIYTDIPRLYTAIAECAACLLYCVVLPRKKRKPLVFIAATAFFFAADAFWLILTDDVPDVFWIPCMFAAMGLMLLYLRYMLEGDSRGIVYTMLKALLIAEFMASLEWQIDCFFREVSGLPRAAGAVFVPVIYLLVSYIAFLFEKQMHQGDFLIEIGPQDLVMTMLIVLLSFFASNLSFLDIQTPFSGNFRPDIFNIRTLVDLTGLAFVFAYQSHVYEAAAERELMNINAMLKAQYEHYRNYQESIDLINYKYHDLKHQLAGLRAEADPEKRAAWIDAMSKELQAYKPETQTGNRVLDGILDQKMPLIRNNKIKFTCVADGKLLDFMHVTDICTIFGNALDNAIESVVTQEDPEKRLIHMTIAPRKKFVYIEVDDYCDHEVRFRGGQPVTSKQDRENHGFGVKSISYTAQKYGGSVSFALQNNFFEMKLLIPVPETAQE